MRILLTGGNGHIGRNLSKLLSEDGHDLITTTKNKSQKNYCNYYGSICDKNFISKLSKNIQYVDLVIHAAALLDGSSRSKIFQVNINGTIELLRLSEMINAKQFIFISGYNFFDLTKKGKITESEIASPSTDYGMSKFLAEKAIEVDKYFRGSKKIFRIPSPVSPDISSNKIFGRFVINAKLNKILEIYGDGKRLQNYLDLRELKNLIVLSFSSNLSGVWNLADEKLISDLDLAHTIVSTINSRSKVVAKFNANYNQDSMREIECCKIVNDFGFKHSFSISDTIKWVSNGLGNIND